MKRKNNTAIVMLSCGIMGIYGFINSKAAFYNIIKLAFDFSDMQLGNIWSVYGIVSLLSYLLGGYVADRISVKKLLILALSLAAVLHLYLSFVPGYKAMLIVAALLSLASVFTFFPASSKLLSFIGGTHSSGGVFGIYYTLAGVWNAVLTLIGTILYQNTQDAGHTFVWLMRSYAAINMLVVIGLFFLLPDQLPESEKEKFSVSNVKTALRGREVWMIAVITMCTYLLFCSFTYISPFLTKLYGIKEDENLIIGLIRVDGMSIIGGILFGKWANRKKSVVSVVGYGLRIAVGCSLVLFLNTLFFHNRTVTIALIMLYSFVAIGTKSISIAMISERRFPLQITGTVIGVVSFIGYSPDAFFYQMMGRYFTRFDLTGYRTMFLLYLCIALIGYICCGQIQQSVDRQPE